MDALEVPREVEIVLISELLYREGVALGLRVGRVLEHVALGDELKDVALRPAYRPSEDWNWKWINGFAKATLLRPASGSGEDWNQPLRVSISASRGVAPGLRRGLGQYR